MTKCRRAMTDPRPTLRAEDARSRRSPLFAAHISELVFTVRFNSGPIELFQRTAANEAYAANMGKHCFK
jgi:hypothetical protein